MIDSVGVQILRQKMREIIKIKNKDLQPIKRKRVAAYARVSGGKDAQLHSLSTQISYYNSYIGSRGDWELAGIYADEAFTGTKENRPEFQRMLSDCKAGKIDMIITKSITRFARNTVTLLSTVRDLKSLDIDVFFEKENIHTLSADGELMLTLLASFAQEESRSASENQKWRIKKLFEQGRATGGNMLGYRFKDGEFNVVPEEAEIVKQIFSDFLSGMGMNSIVKKMNHSGIPAKRGRSWSEKTISSILRNEKYMGDLLLQKCYHSDHINKKKVKNHGERPMYYVENDHEPIISREMFEQVQQEIKRRKEKYSVNSEAPKLDLFSGMIHCMVCDRNFRHKTANANTKYEKTVWRCATFDTRGCNVCPAQQIPEDILIAKTSEVLGITDFDRETLMTKIKEIRVPRHNFLVYVFHDGHVKEVTWQHKSRKESWTEEMKQKAREKSLALAAERKKKCQKK